MTTILNSITLRLPWQDKALSPNARGVWQTKNGPRKVAQQQGAASVNEARQAGYYELPDRLQMWVTFHPPRRGRYDLDNALARLKPAIDGIFIALERDDADVCRVVLERGTVVKGGAVTVILGEITY